ncbi:MAG TPA: DeoR/GlpR family DNA-binding transcription regulator [Candidatus Limnocylindria bacterium]|nr:DeoR/GlpR family DNA-binding transcription regulator [Candidatus Limnocylindria bacterium]
MLKEERQRKILEDLYRQGKVIVNQVSDRYGISRDTVRRDLTELEDQGVLRRVFGGAVPSRMPAAAIDIRLNVQKSEKRTVALKAAALLRPDSLVAIDGGSTNLLLAEAFPAGLGLRVVTNSFLVATALRARPQVEVIFLGGQYDKGSQTTVGETAIRQLASYRFDQFFLGVHAIDARFGVSVPYPYDKEADLKMEMIARSDEVIAMCSLSKLDRHTNYVICPLEQVTTIICEGPVPEETARRYGHRFL